MPEDVESSKRVRAKSGIKCEVELCNSYEDVRKCHCGMYVCLLHGTGLDEDKYRTCTFCY